MSLNIENIKETMLPYDSFSYWFVRDNHGSYRIFDKADRRFLESRFYQTSDSIDSDEYQLSAMEDDVPNDVIKEDFYRFRKSRPEFLIGSKFNLSSNIYELISTYETILIGSLMIRTFIMQPGKDPESIVPRAKGIIAWLRSTDFYSAPASTRFHDSYDGGLLRHTLNVYNECCDLWKLEKFKVIDNPASFSFAALVHDWCKIGLYESYMRNVKDEVTGQWHQEKSYKWRESGPSFSFGHGVSSMFLASRFINLTADEAAAIRWHMGSYRCVNDEFSELQTCNEVYPLVLLLQFADQISLVRY